MKSITRRTSESRAQNLASSPRALARGGRLMQLPSRVRGCRPEKLRTRLGLARLSRRLDGARVQGMRECTLLLASRPGSPGSSLRGSMRRSRRRDRPRSKRTSASALSRSHSAVSRRRAGRNGPGGRACKGSPRRATAPSRGRVRSGRSRRSASDRPSSFGLGRAGSASSRATWIARRAARRAW